MARLSGPQKTHCVDKRARLTDSSSLCHEKEAGSRAAMDEVDCPEHEGLSVGDQLMYIQVSQYGSRSVPPGRKKSVDTSGVDDVSHGEGEGAGDTLTIGHVNSRRLEYDDLSSMCESVVKRDSRLSGVVRIEDHPDPTECLEYGLDLSLGHLGRAAADDQNRCCSGDESRFGSQDCAEGAAVDDYPGGAYGAGDNAGQGDKILFRSCVPHDVHCSAVG